MGEGGEGGVGRPAADAYATASGTEIVVDVPGVAREALRLSAEGRELLLEAEAGDWGGEPLGPSALPRRYRRVFTLPEDADRSAIRARLADGVLRIGIPRREPEPARTIPVE